MTAAATRLPSHLALSPGAALDRLRAGDPALAAAGALLLLFLAPLALAALLDPRLVHGAPVWLKPMRFAFALGVYLLTLAFFAGWIAPERRRGRLFRLAIALGIAATLFEQGWITFQAARGTHSHFNRDTPFEGAMWAMMGVGAVVLTAMAPVIGWRVLRAPRRGLAPVLSVSAGLGLLLTFPLTLLTAGTLALLGGPIVGEGSYAGGLWVMGWSREAGDLRVPHFFATHALHAVPLLGALLIPFLGWNAVRPAVVLAALYALFVALVMLQALAGRPFLPSIG